MKAKKCVLVGNTSYGYCFHPKEFPSISKAKEYAREMTDNGYWFSYRIKTEDLTNKK